MSDHAPTSSITSSTATPSHPAGHDAPHDALVERYIDTLLRAGINVQPGQTVIMQPELGPEIQPFIHRVAERAYALGAGDVVISWHDLVAQRLRVLHGDEAALDHEPRGAAAEVLSYLERGAARLAIGAPDPQALAGLDPERQARVRVARAKAYKPVQDRTMSHANAWSVAAIPTAAWARQVFPDRSVEEGMAELWRVIFAVARADQPDPLAAWLAHGADLKAREALLTRAQFKTLHYRAPGTDLHIELPTAHRWVAGSVRSARGVEFYPNIPTEEVFTAPKRDGVNGTVTSTLPLQLNGQTVEHIHLTLRDGRIVEYGAEQGGEMLKSVIETDEGSHFFGEVALVPITSPCNTGFPFYSTLFDENAASHIAIGRAYPTCIEGGETLSEEEVAARSLNLSMMHVDFMVGSDQLDIDGETQTGAVVAVMRHGLWAEDVGGR